MHLTRHGFLFSCLLFVYVTNPSAATRYQDVIFPSYQLQSDIQYGTNSALLLDTYKPTGDTATRRPLVIFIHGGAFTGGSKVSGYGTRVAEALSRRGYVVASIDYTLTPGLPDADLPGTFEAMLRAMQDTKAAIRYFRKNPALHGVDTSQIFLTGSSAGCKTALHAAYLDSLEVPAYVRWANVGNSFEGSSGNPDFSSRVSGVISCWAAIGDTAWMKTGDLPVYLVHGLTDDNVSYDAIPSDGPFVYGSKYLYEAALRNNMITGLLTFPNTGHTLDNNTTKQDSAIKVFSAWLYTILKQPTSALRSSFPGTTPARAWAIRSPSIGVSWRREAGLAAGASPAGFDPLGKLLTCTKSGSLPLHSIVKRTRQ